VATWDQVCDVLLALPGTAVDPPGDRRGIRVVGKAVAYMPENERSQPPAFDGDEVLVVRTDFDERAALIEQDPSVFAFTPHYETYPGVLIRLSRVDDMQLHELLVDAWRMVAPKRLVRELDAQG
jgi:hypothetical protein